MIQFAEFIAAGIAKQFELRFVNPTSEDQSSNPWAPILADRRQLNQRAWATAPSRFCAARRRCLQMGIVMAVEKS